MAVVRNHFEDCPYSCNDKGKILDALTGQMVDCPHCSQKRKELLQSGEAIEEETDEKLPLAQVLGINSKYLSGKYVFETLIPEGEAIFLEPESIDYLKEVTEKVYRQLTIGEVPEESYCFGVSIKGRVDRLAYPFLSVSYLKGLTVGKFITCSELSRLQLKGSDLIDDLYEADVLLMLISEGSTKGEISCAKGLMQARALKGKSTIFITTWTIEACSLLLGYRSDEGNKLLAKPVFVKYKNSKKASTYINQLTGVENSRYDAEGSNSVGSGQGFSLDSL